MSITDPSDEGEFVYEVGVDRVLPHVVEHNHQGLQAHKGDPPVLQVDHEETCVTENLCPSPHLRPRTPEIPDPTPDPTPDPPPLPVTPPAATRNIRMSNRKRRPTLSFLMWHHQSSTRQLPIRQESPQLYPPPVVEAAPPVAEAAPPVAEAAPPVAEAAPPVADGTPPVADGTTPVADATPPASPEDGLRAPPPSPEDQPRPSCSREKDQSSDSSSEGDEPRASCSRQQDHLRDTPPRRLHLPPPRAQQHSPSGMDVDQPHDVDVGDDVEEHVDGGEGGEGEDDDVEESDDDEDQVIVTNSAKQLTEISWVPGNKFKDRNSILVDGYSFNYRMHQQNERHTTAWYR